MELQHEQYRTEEWAPPPQNIQSLFESVEYAIPAQQQQTILEEDRIVTNELEKLPSTLVKLIKNLDSIRADLEAQKKEMIRTNNDMKHAQNLLLRYAKKCIKQQEKEKEPFLCALIRDLPTALNDLQPHHKLLIYEGLGWMVSVIQDSFYQQQQMSGLMQYSHSELQMIL